MPIYPVKIQTDTFAFLIINNLASINIRTLNYYSQVYIPSVINNGKLIFIEVLFFFFNYHYIIIITVNFSSRK